MQADVITKIKIALSTALGGKQINELHPAMRLREEIGLDSMSSLTFLMALEETVQGFSVDPESLEAQDLETIESIAIYIEKQIKMTGSKQ